MNKVIATNNTATCTQAASPPDQAGHVVHINSATCKLGETTGENGLITPNSQVGCVCDKIQWKFTMCPGACPVLMDNKAPGQGRNRLARVAQ